MILNCGAVAERLLSSSLRERYSWRVEVVEVPKVLEGQVQRRRETNLIRSLCLETIVGRKICRVVWWVGARMGRGWHPHSRWRWG